MNFLLLILLNIAHFLGDFTHLSTKEMLEAKATGWPLTPIAKHALVHACLMMVVLAFFTDLSFEFAAMQFISHFVIDTLKGRMNVWFPVVKDPSKKAHWYLFGADQLLHQIVIIFMVHMV